MTKYRATGRVYDSEHFFETWSTTVTAASPRKAQKAWKREAVDAHPQSSRVGLARVIAAQPTKADALIAALEAAP